MNRGLIATIIYGLKTIQEMGGHFAIITATFPPVLKTFMKSMGYQKGYNISLKILQKKNIS